jgi:hypothetical protein
MAPVEALTCPKAEEIRLKSNRQTIDVSLDNWFLIEIPPSVPYSCALSGKDDHYSGWKYIPLLPSG